MKLTAHGIEVQLPDGWDGRIYRLAGGAPILHAASFALPAADGDFGSGATARMPAGGAFLALKEYVPDRQLVPGRGLFAAGPPSLPLDPRRFHPRALQVGRRGQAGMQHFFTSGGRPFCLYMVVSTVALPRAHSTAVSRTHPAAAVGRLAQLSGIAASLRIAPVAADESAPRG